MDLKVPISSGLQGTYRVPGDKSISHRALILSALAEGKSQIDDCSTAADPRSTRACLELLGVQYTQKGESITVEGKGLYGFSQPPAMLDAGNSGTTIRLLSGVLVGQKFPSSIAGDDSLNKRPMKRIIDPLRQMGARISGSETGTAPLHIQPTEHLTALDYEMPVASAQVKSALLLAGLYAEGVTTIREHVLTRDHTERMMGLPTVKKNDYWCVSVEGGKKPEPQHYKVPGDISAAAFLIVAALIVPHSDIVIQNVGLNPTRTALLDVLRSLNATITIENKQSISGEEIGNIRVRTSNLCGTMKLEGDLVAQVIDEIPVLAIASLFTEGNFILRDGKELRKKESDRIAAMVKNLRTIGVEVEEYEDGFAFEHPKQLRGGIIDSFYDHRIAMAFGVAGLRIPEMLILHAECVDISFPEFWKYLCG